MQTALAKKDKCSLLNYWLCLFKLALLLLAAGYRQRRYIAKRKAK